jgi:hypothetical protein
VYSRNNTRFTAPNTKGVKINITLHYSNVGNETEYRSSCGAFGFFCIGHYDDAMSVGELELEVRNIAATL